MFSGPQTEHYRCQETARDAQCNEPATYDFLYRSTDPHKPGLQPYDPRQPAGGRRHDDHRPGRRRCRSSCAASTASRTATATRSSRSSGPARRGSRGRRSSSGTTSCWSPTAAAAGRRTRPGDAAARTTTPAPSTASRRRRRATSPRSARASRCCRPRSTTPATTATSRMKAESVMMAKERLVEQYGAAPLHDRHRLLGRLDRAAHRRERLPGHLPGPDHHLLLPGHVHRRRAVRRLPPAAALLRGPVAVGRRAWSGCRPQMAAGRGPPLAPERGRRRRGPVQGGAQPRARLPRHRRPGRRRPGHPLRLRRPTRAACAARSSTCWSTSSAHARSRCGSPQEQAVGRGFGGVPFANTGVLYGLSALRAGAITPPSSSTSTPRSAASTSTRSRSPERIAGDPAVDRQRLPHRPDQRGQPPRRGRDHQPRRSGPRHRPRLRPRVLDRGAAAGRPGPHRQPGDVVRPDPADRRPGWANEALSTMDRWLAAVEARPTPGPLAQKVVADRPADVTDRCVVAGSPRSATSSSSRRCRPGSRRRARRPAARSPTTTWPAGSSRSTAPTSAHAGAVHRRRVGRAAGGLPGRRLRLVAARPRARGRPQTWLRYDAAGGGAAYGGRNLPAAYPPAPPAAASPGLGADAPTVTASTGTALEVVGVVPGMTTLRLLLAGFLAACGLVSLVGGPDLARRARCAVAATAPQVRRLGGRRCSPEPSPRSTAAAARDHSSTDPNTYTFEVDQVREGDVGAVAEVRVGDVRRLVRAGGHEVGREYVVFATGHQGAESTLCSGTGPRRTSRTWSASSRSPGPAAGPARTSPPWSPRLLAMFRLPPLTKRPGRRKRAAMERGPHENVATVLVDPAVLPAARGAPDVARPAAVAGRDRADLRRRPAPGVPAAPPAADRPPRRVGRAADWVPAWIAFGESGRTAPEPIPWTAQATLYAVLDGTRAGPLPPRARRRAAARGAARSGRRKTQERPRWMTGPERRIMRTSVLGGQGRGRTADLPLFRRTLVPTELPAQARETIQERPGVGRKPGWSRGFGAVRRRPMLLRARPAPIV